MTLIRRLLGVTHDPIAGGSTFDDLTSGAIPDAVDLWPVQSVTFAKNQTNIDRSDEVIGRRGNTLPESFRQDPRFTIKGRLHPRLAKLVVEHAFGSADAVTPGSGGAATTHSFVPLGYGAATLPALMVQLVRDSENRKASGVAINSFVFDFPHDDDATFEIDCWALYSDVFSDAVPDLHFNPVDVPTYKLRDLQAFFGGSGQSVPNVSGFQLTFTNNLIDDTDVRYLAGRNVATKLDAASKKHNLWFPGENRLGASQTLTGNIAFSSVTATEEVKNDLAVAEQLVVEASAGFITPATTPPALELMRFTIANKVLTGGGPDDLAKEGALKASYDWTGYIDPSDSSEPDIEVQFIDGHTTSIS